MADLDLEELDGHARAAVELVPLRGLETEEPIAEVFMRLENDESLFLREFLGAGNKKQKDSSIGNVRKGYRGHHIMQSY